MIFYLLVIIAVASGLTFLSKASGRLLTVVPDYGGTITEGIVRAPRFVNPILAVSDSDKDMVSLIFSGLLKITPDGKIINDLSKEYSISKDDRTYTFTLKDNIYFHDGEPITAEDVEFTIQKIQDPTVKSPEYPIWDGVLVKKIDARQIAFTLKQPYAPFIENFTIGIIPRHVWKDVPPDEFSFSQLNTEAVGNGPYKINKIKRNSYGLPTFYALRAFENYALGKPFVKNITMRFYQDSNEMIDAFRNGEIDSLSGISPATLAEFASSENTIVHSKLPRVFGVFFNQNQAGVLLNHEVREALTVAIDRDRIIDEVFAGYATAIDSPVPGDESRRNESRDDGRAEESSGDAENLPRTDKALMILSKAGWSMNEKTGVMEKKTKNETVPLSFSIATGDATELKRVAEMIREDWKKIGANVDLKIFEIGDLNQNVIRPRKFDALFFGEIVGREFDLYPFWHSSQRNDPGLNIALYANISADKILENLRLIQDKNIRMDKIAEFEKLVEKDAPAAFVYSPHFIYVVPKKLQNVSVGGLAFPGERFLNVHEWYIETNKVWKFFTD